MLNKRIIITEKTNLEEGIKTRYIDIMKNVDCYIKNGEILKNRYKHDYNTLEESLKRCKSFAYEINGVVIIHGGDNNVEFIKQCIIPKMETLSPGISENIIINKIN